MTHGSCLCGAIRLAITGPIGAVTACHCTQCRKTSGHYAASFDLDDAQLALTGTIKWHVLPSDAKRGFCENCGSSIAFCDAQGNLSVEAGIIDGPTHTQLTNHIFTANKGDYYIIADDAAQQVGNG